MQMGWAMMRRAFLERKFPSYLRRDAAAGDAAVTQKGRPDGAVPERRVPRYNAVIVN
jgi:hypothetical protein